MTTINKNDYKQRLELLPSPYHYDIISNCKSLTQEEMLLDFIKLQGNTKTSAFCGNKIIYNFMLEEMLNTRRGVKSGKIQPLLREIWEDPVARNTLIDQAVKYDRRKGLEHLYPVDIYEAFRFLKGSVNTFKPAIVQYYIKKFNATKYLDPCAGWGGRYLGCRSLGIKYTGCDTNLNLRPKYEEMIKLIEPHQTLEQNDEGFYTDNTRMIFNDFFKVEPSYYGEYDFVLTSPPYSNTEQYNGMEEFNAINNYYNDFLIPLINKLLENILVGGTVCINISNHIYLEYLRCGGKVADEIEEMPQQTANKKNKEMVYIFKKQ